MPIKDQTVKEGQTARFELELSHENIPVTWYRNDLKIHPSRLVLTHVDRKKHVLEMKEVTLNDTCQIKAEAKGIPSMANLTVIGNETSILPSKITSIVCHSIKSTKVNTFVCLLLFCLFCFICTLDCLSNCRIPCILTHMSHIQNNITSVGPFQRAMHTSRLNSRITRQWRKTRWCWSVNSARRWRSCGTIMRENSRALRRCPSEPRESEEA